MKQFDVTMFWQGNVGGKVFNIDRFINLPLLADYNANYWRGEGTSTTQPSAFSSRYLTEDVVESGTYARLRQLTVAYRLPAGLVGRYNVQNARLYVTGQNLLMLTNYSGSNPEANTFGGSNTQLGSDFAAYPLGRVYTLGVNLT
ncbi:MAG: SusC/RagA family TonB-linked outer membrane protein, partial [Leptolyngbya sp. SIO4C5]|nr:SusC/RagA family TonB-linked outer membrane protein [Leptolyngbya sp. SIO4C5]